MWYMHDGSGWGWGWMMLGMLLFWLVVVLAAVYVVRALTRQPPPPTRGDRAREILAERYARGEIESDEYHRRLDELELSRSRP